MFSVRDYGDSSLFIQPLFENSESDSINNQYYHDIILRILKKILPLEFFEEKETKEATRLHQRLLLKQSIPLVTCSDARTFPGNISFYALSKYCPDSFKFFFEMISRWLIPGRRLNVVLLYATDFLLPELNDDVYTICEIMIWVENIADFEEIQQHFPIISADIALGVQSAFYAQRILEVKGVAADEKVALIQGLIAFLVKRFPHVYDRDVFIEMQHVLVMCREEFKAARLARHLSRIIGIQYLFRKALIEAIKKNPQRRYLSLKIFRAAIQTLEVKRKPVLAVLVGINLLRDQETFGEKHLLKAINDYIPTAKAIEKSFLFNKLGSDNIYILYLEIEKNNGTDFTEIEIRKLRSELPTDLKNRIEHKINPVFMPRNEEEVMRNMLILADQIKFLRDIPQVFISFDEQAYHHLSFTVILARILKTETLPISELFKKAGTEVEYIPDRTKIMGYLRKKHPIEASVFRLKLSKELFLRADHSIDLYKARQNVLAELSRIIGEVRDYNGGMISKQHELLAGIRRLLADVKDYNELLLENFFYSLSPVIVRTLLDPKAFRTLFMMLLEGIKVYKQEGYYLKFYTEPHNVFALIIVEDVQVKDILQKNIQDLHIPTTELAVAHTKANGNICIGYVCCEQELNKKEQFLQTIQESLRQWDACRQKS